MPEVRARARALVQCVADGGGIPIASLRERDDLVLRSEVVALSRQLHDEPSEFALRRAMELVRLVLATVGHEEGRERDDEKGLGEVTSRDTIACRPSSTSRSSLRVPAPTIQPVTGPSLGMRDGYDLDGDRVHAEEHDVRETPERALAVRSIRPPYRMRFWILERGLERRVQDSDELDARAAALSSHHRVAD
jgi:hypothetical protein